MFPLFPSDSIVSEDGSASRRETGRQADVLARIACIPQNRLPELLPWEWAAKAPVGQDIAA